MKLEDISEIKSVWNSPDYASDLIKEGWVLLDFQQGTREIVYTADQLRRMGYTLSNIKEPVKKSSHYSNYILGMPKDSARKK